MKIQGNNKLSIFLNENHGYIFKGDIRYNLIYGVGKQ
jgi:hypothetical protein